MAIREILFTVGKNGISPATRQVIGVQDDHRATEVQFGLQEELIEELNDERQSGSDLFYRFDVYDGAGGVIRTDSNPLDALTVMVAVRLDEKMTRYGGNLQVYLVITAVKDEKTQVEINSFPALISMKKKPMAQDTDGASYESMTTLAESTRENAQIAQSSAASALDSAERTEAAQRTLEDGDYFILDGGTAESEYEVEVVVDGELSTADTGHAISNRAVTLKFEETDQALDTIENDLSSVEETVGDADGGLVKDVEDLQEDVSELSGRDYIIAQGTTNGWTWRKWNSGIAECWKTIIISASINTPWGNAAYVSNTRETNLDFPFSFSEVPEINVTVSPTSMEAGTTNLHPAFAISAGAQGESNLVTSTTKTGLFRIASFSSLADEKNFRLNYNAIGRYQQ